VKCVVNSVTVVIVQCMCVCIIAAGGLYILG